MSTKRRRVLAGLSAVLWIWWAVAMWAGMAHEVGWGHLFTCEIVRHLAIMVTIYTMLMFIVPPTLAAMRMGREVGQQEHCTCQRAKVLPLRAHNK